MFAEVPRLWDGGLRIGSRRLVRSLVIGIVSEECLQSLDSLLLITRHHKAPGTRGFY